MALLDAMVVVLLLLFKGFLTMSDMAIVSSRRGRLEQLPAEGSVDAQWALPLAEDPAASLLRFRW